MRSHIKVVAIVNILYSALGLIGAAVVLFSGLFGGLASMFSGSIFGFLAVTAASVGMACVLGALSLFGMIAGFGLLSHQQWARYVVIVVSAMRLFKWPFGTLFGAYSLWVLLNDETRDIFNTSL